MARNNNRNSNNRNNKANNKRISSNNEEQLELIKINVDKVKKDVSDISVHTKKEISTITKKIDELINKLEKSMKLVATQTAKQANETLKQQEQNIDMCEKLLELSNKTLKIEKEKTAQAKEQNKQNKQSQSSNKNNNNDGNKSHTDLWLEDKKSSKDNTNLILQVIKGKGSFSDIMLKNNNKLKDDIITEMKKIESSTTMSPQKQMTMMDDLTNQFNSLDKSAGKIQAAATVMDTGMTVLKTFLNTWLDRFNTGMEKIVSTYESTYTKQAVQTNINQQEYYNKQREMQESLNKQGLQNNIAVSDVMQSTADFVSNGITNMSQAMQSGEQAAIAKTLAPYLDMQSDSFMSMSQTLGPQFYKSIVGISSYVSDNVGSNRFIQKNMNQIISMMEPIVMASNKQIMGDEEWEQIEALMNNGLTESQALAEVSKAMDVIRNPSASLSSGDLSTQIQVANGNFTDISSFIAGDIATSAGFTKGVSDPLAKSYVSHLVNGTLGDFLYLADDSKVSNLEDVANKYTNTNGDTSGSQSSYRTKIQNLADDQYNTAKEQKEILAENLAVEYAILNEEWPDLMKAIKEIVPAIATMFATYIGGKLFGKIGSSLLGNAGKHAATGSSISAIATPLIQVVGGGLAIYDGVKDIGNDFSKASSGDKYSGYATGRAVMDVVEIGAGATAVGAGVATALGAAAGPVGWFALGVAALAFGAKKVR